MTCDIEWSDSWHEGWSMLASHRPHPDLYSWPAAAEGSIPAELAPGHIHLHSRCLQWLPGLQRDCIGCQSSSGPALVARAPAGLQWLPGLQRACSGCQGSNGPAVVARAPVGLQWLPGIQWACIGCQGSSGPAVVARAPAGLHWLPGLQRACSGCQGSSGPALVTSAPAGDMFHMCKLVKEAKQQVMYC
ncbi:hypothetical protein BsWGS_07868 [Bradybaena similaris]